MDNTEIACFDYPKTVLFTDDNQGHLTRITMELSTRLPYSVFSDPQKVLQYIQKHGRPKKTLQIDTAYLEILNPNRFAEPSILVEDYAMPGKGINGFELSVQVKQLREKSDIVSPKIILLSGQAGEDIAKEGFNKKYIDKYISKNDPRCGSLLNQAVHELQTQFAIEQTASLSQELSKQPEFCLKDANFIREFKELCKEHDIVEYFVVSKAGSFLLSQFDGSILWLTVIPEIESKQHDKKAVASFKKISGKKCNYYYELRREPDLVPIQRNKIISLQHYLDNVWAG